MDERGLPDKFGVISIAGCGGLGKTAANQVYHAIRSWFPCEAFLSVYSPNPSKRKILIRDIAQGIGITDTAEGGEKQLVIGELQEHLQNNR